MTGYGTRYAQLYDLFYWDKDYKAEVDFLDSQLRELGTGSPARLLDVACGTGRHAMAFAELGYRVTGVDRSPDMIDVARKRAAEPDVPVDFLVAEMESLSLPGEPFDAVTCLFDSIGYAQTDERIRHALSSMATHLAPGGLLCVEFWHATAMRDHFEPGRVKRFETAEGEVIRISETKLIPDRSLAEVTYSVYELRHDGTYLATSDVQTARYFEQAEIGRLLQEAGLGPLRWFAGFDESAPITPETWHILCVAQKR